MRMFRRVRQVATPGGGGEKSTVSDCILSFLNNSVKTAPTGRRPDISGLEFVRYT